MSLYCATQLLNGLIFYTGKTLRVVESGTLKYFLRAFIVPRKPTANVQVGSCR